MEEESEEEPEETTEDTTEDTEQDEEEEMDAGADEEEQETVKVYIASQEWDLHFSSWKTRQTFIFSSVIRTA